MTARDRAALLLIAKERSDARRDAVDKAKAEARKQRR